jgi:hypothetical protein
LFDLSFLGIDTKISQTISSYNVNIYNHKSCINTPSILFDTSFKGFKLFAVNAGCDLSKTAFVAQLPTPANDTALLTVSIYDVVSNSTIIVSRSMAPDLVVNCFNPIFIFDSTNDQNILDFFNALVNNLIYKISMTMTFSLIPR